MPLGARDFIALVSAGDLINEHTFWKILYLEFIN